MPSSIRPSGRPGVPPCTSSDGMGPSRSLCTASKKVRYGSRRSDLGMVPLSLLRRKLTEVRLVRERDAGMGPETEVTMRLKMERCARLPKESGMGPCRPGMFSMLRVSSWSSSPMAGGSLDVMSRLRRKILVTRPC